MKIHKAIFFIFLLTIILFSACTKVIDINLNASAPRIIIEASLSDQPASCSVSLSKTVNYNEANVFPAVSGAIVTISDNIGNSVTLTETTPGKYSDALFQGVVGRIYTLSVSAEGKTYSAVSTMPAPVSIDTIVQDSISGNPFGQGSGPKDIFVWVVYHDPPVITNYYRFVEVINHHVSTGIFISNDELRDGNYIARRISERDSTLRKGDSVTIQLQSIDKAVYNYLDQLEQVTGGGFGGQTATPANPISNIDNEALGYFSVYSVKSKRIVIQ
jgi:hypothetical protein